MNSTYTYILGAMQVVFGILSLILGWTTTDVAMTLIMTGVGIFGITGQNVKLGKQLGSRI